MDYDENKKIEVEITENLFVENQVAERKTRKKNFRDMRKPLGKSGMDIFDLAIIPISIGVFVSLGFLFANVFKAAASASAVAGAVTFLAGVI